MNRLLTILSTIVLILFSMPVFAGKPSLSFSPSGTQNVPQGASVTIIASLSDCDNNDPVWVLESPSLGTATLDTSNSPNSVSITYTNDGTNGYLTDNDMKFKLTVTCSDQDPRRKDIKVTDDGNADDGGGGGGGGGGGTTPPTGSVCPDQGTVIFDMTANPGAYALESNLGLILCGSKSDTAIDDGIGSNVINTDSFHVMFRDYTGNLAVDGDLLLLIGDSTSVSNPNRIETDSINYFANGQHLFDLDRLRVAADWLTANIVPDAGIISRQYGTITMAEFLQNIAEGLTMYGMVRIKIPLEKGTCADAVSCAKNANGVIVSNPALLYGFCDANIEAGSLCYCAPSANDSANTFKKITENTTLCGHALPANAQIDVKGSLIWDFVAALDDPVNGLLQGDPVPLSLLPIAPRELYFKVEIPININAAHDLNGDGIMDNMSIIAAYNAPYSTSNTYMQPTFLFADVPAESKSAYFFQFGQTLTPTIFDGLDNASKYHIMAPSGYPSGWADAFDKLNITGNMWTALSFGVSADVQDNIITENHVRAGSFEDIPTYLYTGGLIDMHDHCNINGILYVPQGLELEAKGGNLAQQYVSGAIVVRDTFYLQINGVGTMQLISSEPLSFSNAQVTQTVTQVAELDFDGGGIGSSYSPPPSTSGGDSPPCFGCVSATYIGDAFSSGTSAGVGANNWVEIIPET